MAKVDIGIIINAVNRASPALRGAAKDVDNLGKSANRTTGQLRAFHAVVASIATGVLVNMSKRLVEAAGSLQSLNIRLANVTGSFEQANKTFADLSNRFQAAPFDIEVVSQGFTKLAAAGLDLEQTTKLTDALVNSVAAFGGTGPELERAFLGFSQVIGKGTLQMEELKQQISESVPIATRLMASEAGKSVAQFTNDVAKGLITADEAVKLFIGGASKAVGNFAELLGFTINGSLARIGTMFKIGLNDILQNTTFDERLVVIFRNVGDAVLQFMQSISEQKVKAFFDWLRLIGNQAEKVIGVMVKLGSAVAQVVGAIIKVIDFLPADAVQFGVLGYLLLGRVGGKIGSVIVAAGTAIITVLNKIGVQTKGLVESLSFGFSFGIIGLMFFGPLGAGIIAAIATALHAIFADADSQRKKFFQEMDGQTYEVTPGAGRVPAQMRKVEKQFKDAGLHDAAAAAGQSVGESFWDGIMGSEAQVQEVINNLNAMAGKVQIPTVDTTPFDKNADKMMRKLDGIREKSSDVIRNVSDALDTLERSIAGDELGEAVAQINDQWGDTTDKLEDAIAKSMALNAVTGQESDQIQRMNELLLRAEVLRDKAILKEQQMYDLKVQQAELQAKINTMQIEQSIRETQQSVMDPMNAFLSQSEGFRIVNEVAAQRSQLQTQILNAQQEINDLNSQLIYEQNPAIQEGLQKQIDAYTQLQAASEEALSQLSTTGKATAEFWSDVGSSVFSSVNDAILGVIKGTLDWRDVMSRVFDQLAQMALDYLGKLIMIKAIEAATGMATGMPSYGNAANTASGFLGPIADGAAFNGKVTPFANGGVIPGPTLFGLAGEAGPEAIMPLERIGGKLGVRATDAGGDNYHFSIHAIDTQSGVDFLMKHMDSIVGGVRHRGRLNHGLGRTL